MEWLRLGARARRELSGEERAHRANYIASVLNAGKVDELRRIAVESGFLSAALRRKIWPLLLNIQDEATASRQCDRDLALDHREKKQVQLDVVRSMTHFGLNRENRDVRLKQLSRVIDSVLAANPALHYYQGYNDVCSVAIMVMDNEDAARQVAQQLARYYLREAMNPTMAAVQQALTFMMLILKRRDKPLYNCLRACEVEPVFAISWIITWFAHDIKSLPQVVCCLCRVLRARACEHMCLTQISLTHFPYFPVPLSCFCVLWGLGRSSACMTFFELLLNFLSL